MLNRLPRWTIGQADHGQAAAGRAATGRPFLGTLM